MRLARQKLQPALKLGASLHTSAPADADSADPEEELRAAWSVLEDAEEADFVAGERAASKLPRAVRRVQAASKMVQALSRVRAVGRQRAMLPKRRASVRAAGSAALAFSRAPKQPLRSAGLPPPAGGPTRMPPPSGSAASLPPPPGASTAGLPPPGACTAGLPPPPSASTASLPPPCGSGSPAGPGGARMGLPPPQVSFCGEVVPDAYSGARHATRASPLLPSACFP